MSEVAESAHVRITLADYAAPDAGGKLNIIGAGIAITGFDPQNGVTAPLAVVAVIDFASQFVGESPAVELLLEHENGQPVPMPTVVEQEQPQYLRVGDSNPLSAPVTQGIYVPPNVLRLKKQFVMHFANGLPLAPGQAYRWRVKVDHLTRDEWTETMYVPAGGTGPVLG